MKRLSAVAAVFLLVPGMAFAHVSVRPREAKPGAEEKYTVRVPTANWTPGTKLTETPAAPGAVPLAPQGAGHAAVPATGEAAVIEKWLAEYDAAFNAKDLDKLGTFYHPQVTIYEGGGIDNGWASYRDGHLGPELKAFENLQFGHSNRRIQILGDGKSAYVVSTYTLKAKMGERAIDSGGLETLVLAKGDDGGWKIRHSHTSSRPRRPPQ